MATDPRKREEKKMEITGYKGFDRNMKCKDFQFENGKTFTHSGTVSLCNSGFHFCENPLDVLRYYGPATSKYAEVKGDGVSDEKEQDSKRVSSTLHVGADLSLSALIGLGVKFVLDRTKTEPVKGNFSPAATSGKSSPAATSGNYSHAATSGYYSHAATSGKDSIAASIGREAKAKAALGSWIVLAEYKPDSLEVLTVKTAKVDGKKIKADTFYKLSKGKFVVAKD